MSWYLKVWKNYANFTGRARRTEYWMFTLINAIIYIIVGGLGAIMDSTFLIMLYGVYGLAIIVPSLAVLVRRLHDTGRSGWWFFISFVPFVGAIILLVFTCLDSQMENNEYGSNPKLSA